MRWVGVGACSVVFVVGCRGNPWFILDDDGATGMSSAASMTDESTASPDSSSSSGMSTGSSTTSTDSGPDTGLGDSEAVDTSTGATDTSDSTTGAPDTDSSSSGSDGTTGDVEEEIYDLHERCAAMQTGWVAAFEGDLDSLSCDTSQQPKSSPWVGYLPKLMVEQALETTVVAALPEQKVGAQLTGEYNGLTLAGAVAPHLRALLVCPASDKPCSIIGSVIVELPATNEFVTGELEIPLGPGQIQDIDIDLTPELALLSSQEFRVVLVVTAQNGDGGDRGAWVRPRIVDLK